jgi:chromosome segregation ATPase
VGLLIVFGLGFLAAIFTIYNQKTDELDQSKSDLSNAGTTIAELEDQIGTQQDQINSLNARIDSLNQTIADLETQNEELASEQDSFNLQIALLRARADVLSAQLELQEGNPTQARVLIQSAEQTLTVIETLLPEDLKDIVGPLQSRLELAISGIEEDPETSMTDLSKVAGDLQEIENAKVWE